jgi:hypothetical protein
VVNVSSNRYIGLLVVVFANYPKVSNSVLANVAIEMNSILTYSVTPKVSHVSSVLFCV